MSKQRTSLTPEDRDDFVQTVIDRYQDDLSDRADWSEARLQRYAKLRGWMETKNYPWPDACFTLDTELLTVTGWRPVGEVQVGDDVYTMDAQGCATYAPVAGTTHEWTETLVHFLGKSIDLLVTPNHQMVVTRKGRQVFARADSFLEKQNSGHIPLTSSWKGSSPDTIHGIDARAYVRALGWYLSEGHACYISKTELTARRNGSFGISQSASANPEKCAILERDLHALGCTWKKYDKGYTIHAKSLPSALCAVWREQGTQESRYIPDDILALSPALLTALLETMILGDGTTDHRNGHQSYYTISQTLADDVQILAQRIGLRGTITKKQPTVGGTIHGRVIHGAHPIYTVSLNAKPSIKVQSLARTLVEQSCPVACVDVPPHHTLYVRRNGKAVWCGNSNQHIPMLMTNSQRTQDTLHNAVMGSRPVMSAIAVNKVDAEKGTSIDELQDYQLFVEQNGEEKIGELITSFVDDGKAVAFIPWVKETREVRETKPIPQPAPGTDPQLPLLQTLAEAFPGSVAERHAPDRFTVRWTTETGQKQQAKVSVFEDEDGATFAQITKKATIFDGPCIIPVSLEDLVVPSRAANLQPPGPSNPNGADHVVMVDYPSWDEIKRLQDRGYYDLLEDEELEVLEDRVEGELGDTSSQTMTDPEQHKVQKDALAGQTYGNAKTSSKVFTRLTYFGRWDIDDDGFEEEIVARVLLESKQLCRVRHLQDEYPTPTPRRPFAEATFLPVPGQFYGISLIELLEHLHDLSKVIFDQMIDKHSISNSPWGLYRSASGMRPEVVRMSPGELYPVSNPQTDVVFPQLPLGDQSVAINILALLQQWAEKSSMQGALQFGAVPQGKSSALRTSSNMANVLQQGDARPERILRRFFLGLSEIYQQMHELNQAFLPPKKQYRVTGVVPPGSDPYKTVENTRDISGRFQFDFKANSLNTNKAAQAQILTQLSQLLVNGMTFQMGLMDKEKLYNLMSDIVKANGQDPNRYVIPPPDANVPKLTAEDAMGQMAQGILPQGIPSEGAQQHLQTLQQFMRDPRYAMLLHSEPAFQLIFQTYVQQVQGLVQKQQQEAMMAQQFANMQGGGGGGQPGPEGQVDPQADQMNLGQGPGQVGDESLPGAKGMG